jgi:hypothetical protein
MKHLCLALVLAAVTLPALAQSLDLPFQTNRELREQQDGSAPGADAPEADAPQAPLLRVDFPETEAIPGQPLTLRLTVLVPTFMPAPPVWPTLEAPNLLVRLPEGATGPVSERIGGATWSGIARRYQISPMVPGSFAIPAQEVAVTWRDPETGDDARTTLSTEPIAFSGVIPAGAEELDPFVAAEELELTQEIDSDPAAMVPGDSVTRTLTVRVEGVSPMFLPDLLAPVNLAGVAAYPEEPVLAERQDRGATGGTRTERVTYVAEGGGGGTVPPVALEWFNIAAGAVETARADGFAIAVEGPPAARAEPRDQRIVIAAVLSGLLLAAVALVVVRSAVPRLKSAIDTRLERWRSSEAFAWRDLSRAVSRRDHAALRPALDLWAARVEGPDPRRNVDVQAALLAFGAALYGAGKSAPASAGRADAWNALRQSLLAARRISRTREQSRALPPLNTRRA